MYLIQYLFFSVKKKGNIRSPAPDRFMMVSSSYIENNYVISLCLPQVIFLSIDMESST